MARGSVVGEAIVSQASTKAFDENADRIGLGKSKRSKERGSFVWSKALGKLVRPWEVEQESTARAIDAPVMSGRFYENTGTVEGVDIGSRRKRKDYMRRSGLVDANEAHEAGRDEAKRAAAATTKQRRADLERRLYTIVEMPQARYERELKNRERERLRRGEEGL